MGWFGIVSIITALARQTVYDVEKGKLNRYGRKHPTEYGTYRDAHGVERSVSNNHIISRSTHTGDLVLEDTKTGEQVNITLAKLNANWDEEVAKAKKYGKTVIPYGNNNHVWGDMQGRRFVDINTQKLYVMRQVFGEFNGTLGRIYFLADPQTGKLVRKTDGQLVRDNFAKSYIKKMPQAEMTWRRKNDYIDSIETIKFIQQYNTNAEFRSKYVTSRMDEDKSW